MAQLSDDCFAFGGSLLRLDAALDDLASRLGPVAGPQAIPLRDGLSRVCAEAVHARAMIPNAANSAVDGVAVRHADLNPEGGTRLPISQRIPAGRRDIHALLPATAARIFTGAMMPAGADTVFMQEDVRFEGDFAILPAGLKPGANRRHAGEDFRQGALIVATGTRLKPQHIAGLAAAGVPQLSVRERLRVAIFSTGDEIVDGAAMAAEALPPGCQFDSNRPMLAALLAMRGMETIDLGILPDRQEAIAAALAKAAGQCDAILTSGGVSTGEEDHVKAALEAEGRLDFWRLAIKPGRPVAMGTVRGCPFFGMPGNPAAVFVTFTRFVGPVLDMLQGATPSRPPPFMVESGFDYAKKLDRREYVRVSLSRGQDGRLIAQRFPKDGAALISSLIAADGLAELDESCITIRRGQLIPVLPMASLLG